MIDGPGVIVEIDECKFGKQNYNRGKRIYGNLVFDGVERGSNRCFMQVAENHTPDTHDCWKAYGNIGKKKITINRQWINWYQQKLPKKMYVVRLKPVNFICRSSNRFSSGTYYTWTLN